MPIPEREPRREDAADWAGVNVDLTRLVAAAADLCRKPLRHAVVRPGAGEGEESLLRIEARSSQGERIPEEDLELEIYRSGGELNLTIAWCTGEERPILWHGSHPVWMDGTSGVRCERPAEGMPLEALARRLRALLSPDR